MVIYTESIHDTAEPTFVSKRQWVPRCPPNFAFWGDGKKISALMRRSRPSPQKACTKSPPMRPAQSAEFFFVVPSTFSALCKYNIISRFSERFRDGQHSMVSLLFAVLLLTVGVPVHYGVGATVVTVHRSKRSLYGFDLTKIWVITVVSKNNIRIPFSLQFRSILRC